MTTTTTTTAVTPSQRIVEFIGEVLTAHGETLPEDAVTEIADGIETAIRDEADWLEQLARSVLGAHDADIAYARERLGI